MPHAASSTKYVRERDLPGLIPAWPHELRDHSLEGHARLVARLRRALRRERRAGLAGHWTYDLARHHALLAAYRAETCALAARLRQRPYRHKVSAD